MTDADAPSLAHLEDALAQESLEAAPQLVDVLIASGGWLDIGDAAIKACRRVRRYDLACRLHLFRLRAGIDPYEAPYAAIDFWRDAPDGEATACFCRELDAEVRGIEFGFQNDAFHREKVAQALADIARLALLEDGAGEPEALEPGSMHGIAVDALWNRVWMAHASLQFPKAQRLVLAYLALVAPPPSEVLHCVATFFAFRGVTETGLGILDRMADSGEDEARRRVLALAMSYDGGLIDRAESELMRLTAPAGGGGVGGSQSDCRATAELYRVRLALDRECPKLALSICEAAEAKLAGNSLAAAFGRARGLALEETDLSGAVASYAASLAALQPSYSPFGIDPGADACAALGRWDLTYRFFEGPAADIRAAYAPIVEQQPPYDTSRPETFPRSALFLSGWGIGDDVFRLGLLRAHFSDGDYTVMLDRRLVAMAERATPSWRFLSHSRVHEVGRQAFWRERAGVPETIDPLRCPRAAYHAAQTHGAVVVQEDMSPIHAASRGVAPFANRTPTLMPSTQRLDCAREWLRAAAGNRPAIGLCWRSGVFGAARNRSFFGPDEIADLMCSADVAWVLLQYDWAAQELSAIEAKARRRFLVQPGLDLRNDLEGVAALGLACHQVMSTGVSTREICAAAGANVYSISFGWPHANAWRRDADGVDTIFPVMRHANPLRGRSGILAQAKREAARVERVRA